MPATTHPFQCDTCDQQPAADFVHFEPTNDWLIAYPEKNLIHVHLGSSALTDDISLEQATVHNAWAFALFKRYPDKKFFYVIDMTRKDHGEMMPVEARNMLNKLRSHPQMASGAIYGLTWAWRMLVDLLNKTGSNTQAVANAAEAQAAYLQWYKTQH